jgi:hypothetical protein
MGLLKTYINNKNGMENLQSIVIVSIGLFIYEFLLFNLNLVPSVKNKLRGFINNLQYNSDNASLVLLKPLLENNIVLDMFHVFYDRELTIIKKVNTYTVITGIILFIGLLFILYLLNKKQYISLNVIMMSIIILIFILIFQYLFYLFGKNYNYLDSISIDELQYFILKNL